MTIKLRWRSEDLTFRTCRSRTAFELETFFGTSDSRHKLKNWEGSVPPTSQAAIATARRRMRRPQSASGRWTTSSLISGTQPNCASSAAWASPNSSMWTPPAGIDSAPASGGLSICVSGWKNDDKYGPASRIKIFRRQSIAAGKHTRGVPRPAPLSTTRLFGIPKRAMQTRGRERDPPLDPYRRHLQLPSRQGLARRELVRRSGRGGSSIPSLRATVRLAMPRRRLRHPLTRFRLHSPPRAPRRHLRRGTCSMSTTRAPTIRAVCWLRPHPVADSAARSTAP